MHLSILELCSRLLVVISSTFGYKKQLNNTLLKSISPI